MAAAEAGARPPVVIVGAGPAGLVAAVTLARAGVGSLLVERNPGLSPLPRATHVSTRTMELLRSWGLEDEVRAGQLAVDSTAAWAGETLVAAEGTVLPLGIADLGRASAASPTTLAAVPQDRLEPVLLRHLERLGRAEVRFGTELVALDQDPDGVTVTLADRATGRERRARAAYLVGADGAHSAVRCLLGIAMAGPDHLDEQLSVLFEAPWPGWSAAAATASTSSGIPRPAACWCPTAPATGGCTGGAGTRPTSGSRATPTSAWPASSAPPPACPTCRSGSWPRGRSRSRPRSPTATGGAGRCWSATPPSG